MVQEEKPLKIEAEKFLAAFAASGSILKAARWSKQSRLNHYYWLKSNPEYARRFAEARKKTVDLLKDEAFKRAHDGVRKAVYHKGKIVGYELEYSDTMLCLLLKAYDPETFRDRTDVKHSGDITIKRVLGVPDEAV